jgi:hypothetical protein
VAAAVATLVACRNVASYEMPVAGVHEDEIVIVEVDVLIAVTVTFPVNGATEGYIVTVSPMLIPATLVSVTAVPVADTTLVVADTGFDRYMMELLEIPSVKP